MICVLYARNSACAYIIKRDIKHAHTHTHTFHYTRVLTQKGGTKRQFQHCWLALHRALGRCRKRHKYRSCTTPSSSIGQHVLETHLRCRHICNHHNHPRRSSRHRRRRRRRLNDLIGRLLLSIPVGLCLAKSWLTAMLNTKDLSPLSI